MAGADLEPKKLEQLIQTEPGRGFMHVMEPFFGMISM